MKDCDTTGAGKGSSIGTSRSTLRFVDYINLLYKLYVCRRSMGTLGMMARIRYKIVI